jgi:estrogen-related receptor beta like 1
VNVTLSELREQYTTIRKELTTLETSFVTQEKSANEKSSSLAEMTHRLEDIKQTLDTKGETMSDASPLVVIRHALTQLKSELAEMDIATGILQSRLVNAQLSQGTRAAKTAAKSTRTRVGNGDFDEDEGGFDDGGDDSDDSDWSPSSPSQSQNQSYDKYDRR